MFLLSLMNILCLMETFVVSLMQILVPGIKLKIQLNPENELFPALLASLDFKCVFESSCRKSASVNESITSSIVLR